MAITKLGRKPLPCTFDDLFNEIFGNFFSDTQSTLGFDALPCNEYLEDNHYKIEVAAAGFSKDEISVEVDKDTLSIKIEHPKKEENSVEKTYLTKKIARRSFRLSKLIPPEYDLDKVECTFKDGLLMIDVPPKKELTSTVKSITIS